MNLENLEKLKIGDNIYSFVDNKFYTYTVTNINLLTREITIRIDSVKQR